MTAGRLSRKRARIAARRARELYGPGLRVRARRRAGKCCIEVSKIGRDGHAIATVRIAAADSWAHAARQAGAR